MAGREVVLAKPETFMNLSGLAVAALVKEFEADPARDLLVIYDELDLVLGTLKIRERGSPAGHNGARSVTGPGQPGVAAVAHWRGLDLPPEAIAAGGGRRPGRDYLLSPMRKADLTVLDEVLDRVATGHAAHSRTGPAAAMNEFNRREDKAGIRGQGTGIGEQAQARILRYGDGRSTGMSGKETNWPLWYLPAAAAGVKGLQRKRKPDVPFV